MNEAQTFKRGDAVKNTATGDVGVVIHAPIYMENSRQWNVCVQIPGRKHHAMWYLPHVESADPYQAVTAGDVVKVPGKRGHDLTAEVCYVSRKREWVSLFYQGREYIYKGPILGIKPASVRA